MEFLIFLGYYYIEVMLFVVILCTVFFILMPKRKTQ